MIARMRTHASTTRGSSAARLLLAVLLLCCFAVPSRAAEEEARVLILNGTDPYLPASLAIDNAMRETLAKSGSRRYVYFSEQLDGQRFRWEDYGPELLALLTKKYSDVRIDVIVALTQPALDFALRHRGRLWPGARVVFHSVPMNDAEAARLPEGVTGIDAREDIRGTIDIARRLQPGARRILVVSGVSDYERYLAEEARRQLHDTAGLENVEFLAGLPEAALMSRLEHEATDTIVLYLVMFRDRDGRPYTPREFLRAISAVSSAPVYGMYETFVGAGLAAGSMESFADRGRLIAELVQRAMDGKFPPPGSVFPAVARRCVADERALRRWSLDAARLPAGCEIRFADRPLWRRYWWQIALALAIIVGQAALIMTLLAQFRHRRSAEAKSRQLFSETTHMNRRLAMGELSASIAHELNQPLGAIHNNAAAAELLLKADAPRLRDIAEILGDIRRDDQRASDIIARVRTLVRKSEPDIQDIDLNEAIGEAVKVLSADASAKGVSMKTELDAVLPKVSADRVQVQQVILNLTLNAMEAMQDQPEQKRELVIRSTRANGKEAEVSVADCGAGIPDGMLARIFEPFVTTKSGGMGLGLAICRSIVEAQGGHIRAEGAPQGGAVIRFTLPLAAARGASGGA